MSRRRRRRGRRGKVKVKLKYGDMILVQRNQYSYAYGNYACVRICFAFSCIFEEMFAFSTMDMKDKHQRKFIRELLNISTEIGSGVKIIDREKWLDKIMFIEEAKESVCCMKYIDLSDKYVTSTNNIEWSNEVSRELFRDPGFYLLFMDPFCLCVVNYEDQIIIDDEEEDENKKKSFKRIGLIDSHGYVSPNSESRVSRTGSFFLWLTEKELSNHLSTHFRPRTKKTQRTIGIISMLFRNEENGRNPSYNFLRSQETHRIQTLIKKFESTVQNIMKERESEHLKINSTQNININIVNNNSKRKKKEEEDDEEIEGEEEEEEEEFLKKRRKQEEMDRKFAESIMTKERKEITESTNNSSSQSQRRRKKRQGRGRRRKRKTNNIKGKKSKLDDQENKEIKKQNFFGYISQLWIFSFFFNILEGLLMKITPIVSKCGRFFCSFLIIIIILYFALT